MSDVVGEMHALRERMRAEYDATVKRAEELRAALAMMGEELQRAEVREKGSPRKRVYAPGDARIAMLRFMSQRDEVSVREVAAAIYGSNERIHVACAWSVVSQADRRGWARKVRSESVAGQIRRNVYAITDAGREYLATHGGE